MGRSPFALISRCQDRSSTGSLTCPLCGSAGKRADGLLPVVKSERDEDAGPGGMAGGVRGPAHGGGRVVLAGRAVTVTGPTSLDAVAAVSAHDAWAVGFAGGFRPPAARTVIEHWDGAALP